VKDFTPISSVCVNPLVLVTHPSMPDSVTGLVELMKKNPGKYSYASSGNGSILHLCTEYFKKEVGGMDVEHVPYKGSGRRCRTCCATNVQWMIETFSTTCSSTALARCASCLCSCQARADRARDPDHDRGGVKGYEAYTFNLILGPAGLPRTWSTRSTRRRAS
jgi:tripartite-type tricarboxylate transporter receptor subunit TctC